MKQRPLLFSRFMPSTLRLSTSMALGSLLAAAALYLLLHSYRRPDSNRRRRAPSMRRAAPAWRQARGDHVGAARRERCRNYFRSRRAAASHRPALSARAWRLLATSLSFKRAAASRPFCRDGRPPRSPIARLGEPCSPTAPHRSQARARRRPGRPSADDGRSGTLLYSHR